MAKSASETTATFKAPPPSVSVYFNKQNQVPDGFEDVDVDDQATLIVKGKVAKKSHDRNGGSIEIEWKSIAIEPGKIKSMSLKDAMDKVMAKREL